MSELQQKVEVFQNWIPHIPRWIYEVLFEHKILDGLKFPGTGVDANESMDFIKIAKDLGCSVDNHGWRGITGALHDPDFAKQIKSFSGLKDYLTLPGASNFSSHIGAPTSRIPYGTVPQEWFDDVLVKNLRILRDVIASFSGYSSSIYGEGLFPTHFDERTITPEFINSTLKSNGLSEGLDGLVLDISHSSIAADYLCDKQYSKGSHTFEDYVLHLDLSKVYIVHCSGGYGKVKGDTCSYHDHSSMDPHISGCDWEKFLFVLMHTPNLRKVSNEIAYSFYHGYQLQERDYCVEAVLTRVATTKCTLASLKSAETILLHLRFDCKNLEEILEEVKKNIL